MSIPDKKLELLLPAGNIEKMEYAINYGADAVYMGIADFSLRSMKAGDIICHENIKDAIAKAHKLGAKVYVTYNIYAHNYNLKDLEASLEIVKDADPDAIIFSDPGVFRVIRKTLPDIPLHVSTQANTLNFEAVKFWRDLGIKRVILARELSIKEIAEIKNEVPDIELETFVHGSQCVSLSGRCLLSDYMTHGDRKANQGGCAQPCRWKYRIEEETRPGQYYEIQEDPNGTYILSPKDLALVEYIPDLINAGVDSVKVEGRTKSVYYASVVAKVYKTAINNYYNDIETNYTDLMLELSKTGNRGFTTGFYLGKPDANEYNYKNSKGMAGAIFLGLVKAKEDNNRYVVKVKNRFELSEEVEIITPTDAKITKVINILNQYGIESDFAKTNEEALITFDLDRDIDGWENGIVRTLGVRNAV